MNRARHPLLVLAATLPLACGCALTSKADALDVHYFTPEGRTGASGSARSASKAPMAGPELRLGKISSGANLRERIMYREHTHEIGYYDGRRWAERPELFVERALVRSLFDERALARVVSGSAPTLDVDVVAFEEVRLPGRHAARVELRMVLSDERSVLAEGTYAAERPVSGEGFDAVVAAMGEALDAAVADVARRTDAVLRAGPR